MVLALAVLGGALLAAPSILALRLPRSPGWVVARLALVALVLMALATTDLWAPPVGDDEWFWASLVLAGAGILAVPFAVRRRGWPSYLLVVPLAVPFVALVWALTHVD